MLGGVLGSLRFIGSRTRVRLTPPFLPTAPRPRCALLHCAYEAIRQNVNDPLRLAGAQRGNRPHGDMWTFSNHHEY
jgi:hypothetical protein